MPRRPAKPCSKGGCGALTFARFCDRHAKEYRQQSDQRRGSAASRGYGRRWQKARAEFLADNPLCVRCRAKHRVTAATVVDHIVPHKGDQDLFWNRANWQALCKAHHDEKTAAEDGAFGRPAAGR